MNFLNFDHRRVVDHDNKKVSVHTKNVITTNTSFGIECDDDDNITTTTANYDSFSSFGSSLSSIINYDDDNDNVQEQLVATGENDTDNIIEDSIHTTVTEARKDNSCNSSTKRISFSDEVHVREYERILSNHPSCSDGPAIGIGWEIVSEKVCNITVNKSTFKHIENDKNEEGTGSYNDDDGDDDILHRFFHDISSTPKRSSSSRTIRRRQSTTRLCMPLSAQEREDILINLGYDCFEIAASIQEIQKIQNERVKSERLFDKELMKDNLKKKETTIMSTNNKVFSLFKTIIRRRSSSRKRNNEKDNNTSEKTKKILLKEKALLSELQKTEMNCDNNMLELFA